VQAKHSSSSFVVIVLVLQIVRRKAQVLPTSPFIVTSSAIAHLIRMHSPAHSLLPPPEPLRPQPELTDVETVNAVIGGQREMFEVIVRRYNTQLYRVGMAYLRNHAMTEDAMQNAYLKAFLNLQRFRGTAAFSTWLTRIMINECLMILRSRKRFVMETLDDGNRHIDHEFFAEPAPDSLDSQDVKKLLEHHIEKLPRAHRAVYLLREVQHLSTDETAKCLGMSRDNVKVCLHRAREELKAQLLKSAAGVELFNYPAQYCDPMTATVMRAILEAPSNSAA
jgi:RNA polymerase sigma factor (sigma-70 family)